MKKYNLPDSPRNKYFAFVKSIEHPGFPVKIFLINLYQNDNILKILNTIYVIKFQ